MASPPQPQELHTEPDNDKHNPRMTIGSFNVYVVRRGDKFALRIKDAKSAALVGFHGLQWYPPQIQLSRHRSLDSVRSSEIHHSRSARRRQLSDTGTGSGGIHSGGQEISTGAGAGRSGRGQAVLHSSRHHQHVHNLRGVPVSLHRLPDQRIGQGRESWCSISTIWKIRPAPTRRTPRARCLRSKIVCRFPCLLANCAITSKGISPQSFLSLRVWKSHASCRTIAIGA